MAWFFRHDSCREELRQLRDELATTKRELDEMSGQVRLLRTEWAAQLDLFQKVVERVLKRAERADKNNNGAARGESDAAQGPDPISARILQRRQQRGILQRG